MKLQFEKHAALVRTICCPTCHAALSWPDADTYQGIPVNGTLRCERCGDVGHAANLKLIFNEAACQKKQKAQSSLIDGQLRLTEHAPSISDTSPAGSWSVDGRRLWSAEENATLTLPAKGHGVGLLFLKHPWSGHVRISLNGSLIATLDLFEENGSAEFWFPVYTGNRGGMIQIEVLGTKNPKSAAAQAFFLGYQILESSPSRTPAISYATGNKGNPYPAKFAAILEDLPPDALVLDCGSGDRSYPDARVINFEYSRFGLPDIFGDGHQLPFRDNSFDFILSQAVIEHLYNPFLAVNEIHRVLKPGGVVYAESAFMQPLHAVPYHFYNTTGWGLANLFKEFDVVNLDNVGTLGQTVRWIYELTNLRAKGHGQAIDQIIDQISNLDQHITPDELRSFSSFVTITAKKKELQ